MKLRQAAAHLALALLLLLSQQLGLAHAVSHLAPDNRPGTAHQKQLPPELQCDRCLAFAAIGSAVDTPAHSFFIGLAAGDADPLSAAVSLHPSSPRAFDSRAPPVVIR